MRWVCWWLKGGLAVMVAKVWVECGGSERVGWLWDDEEEEYHRQKLQKKSKTEMSASIKLQNNFTTFTDCLPSRCFIPNENRLLELFDCMNECVVFVLIWRFNLMCFR